MLETPAPTYRVKLPGGRRRAISTAGALWQTVDEIARWYLRRAARSTAAASPDRDEDDSLLRQIGTAVFRLLAPEKVHEYAALLQIAPEVWEAYYALTDEDEDEEPTPRHIFDVTLRESIIDHLAARWEELESPAELAAHLWHPEELVVFTQEEVRAIGGASDTDPWMDQDGSAAPGNGYVFPLKYLDALEGLRIPAGVTGARRWGMWIDGYLPDALATFQEVLGQRCLWRAWPVSDFALALPGEGYALPLDDPLLRQLAQAIPLEETFLSLADLRLTFIEIEQGYLIAQDEQGQFQAWWRLPDDGLVIEGPQVALAYEGDLYCWCASRPTVEEIRQLVAHELGK